MDASAPRSSRGADAQAAAVAAARSSYGRMVAWLAWQWRDIAAAEDAMGEAFASALLRWPAEGIPASPEGWLMTAAKRQLLMAARRQRLAEDPTLTVLWPADGDFAPEQSPIPDDRLRLLFVCTHPAIDAASRSALMLQTVLGIDAARIASAFLVAPQAMAKRLVRAKAKIKASGIRFDVPAADELEPRVQAVLEAIYGAYVLDVPHHPEEPGSDLAQEALFLAGLLVELMATHLPGHAEALGLLALLQFCEGRKPARHDAQGRFVPLDEQDCGRWDSCLIDAAHAALARAAALSDPGPFQIEAAIQAAHCHRAVSGSTPWVEITALYERLLATAPTIGAQIGHAIALAQARDDPAAGLRCLDAIDAKAVVSHQPWWAARMHFLQALGRRAEAQEAGGRALALTADPALRAFLAARLQRDGPAPLRSGSTAD